MIKQQMMELWIANIRNSNMDLQFILEEYSCTTYMLEYFDKTSCGINNFHRELIKLQSESNQDYTSLLNGVSLWLLNNVEMTSQQTAWYLLRLPKSETSRDTINVEMCWPHQRQKTQKTSKQMEKENLTDDSTDVLYDNIINKYKKRPIESMANITLADFTTEYTLKQNGEYKKREMCLAFYVVDTTTWEKS
jgi:hypothetical protein